MNDPTEVPAPVWLGFAVLAAFCASVAIWGWVAWRLARSQKVVPYQARRPVPWQAVDLFVIFVVHIVLANAVVELDRLVFPEVVALAAQRGDEEASTQHDVLILLRGEQGPTAWIVCLLAAVIVAPITEEVFFRLLLQGWLEKVERRWRQRLWPSQKMLRGFLPVLASTFVFAGLHFRTADLPPNPRVLFHVLVGSAIVKLVTIGFGLVWVRTWSGATWEDLGIRRGTVARDAVLGFGAALAVIPWTYVLQWTLTQLLPPSLSPDPFTLIPFAVVLGFLYYRTHRLIAPIVLHTTLNAASLALAWSVL